MTFSRVSDASTAPFGRRIILEQIERWARAEFEAKNAARERALAHSRELTRTCANSKQNQAPVVTSAGVPDDGETHCRALKRCLDAEGCRG